VRKCGLDLIIAFEYCHNLMYTYNPMYVCIFWVSMGFAFSYVEL